jgi:peptidoglycan/xylan/chitin deacetylase (PgdA/CDA1 family)
LWQLWRAGQTVVLWNVDPKDWACQETDELRAWFQRHVFRGGDIVLMHDDRPHAAEIVPDLSRFVRANGLEFKTLLQWLP